MYVTNATSQVNQVRYTYVPIRRNMWGPLLWKTMHSFGRVLREVKDGPLRDTLTRETSNLVDILIRSIPCPSCRNHATQYKMSHRIANANTKADSFEDWAYHFHNEVNRRIQKIMIGREQANTMYINVDPLKTLDEYLQSINSKTRHELNEGDIRNRAKTIIAKVNI